MQSQANENVTQSGGSRAAAIERILSVTGEEAQRVGPERIRMGEIAKRAEVSRASLYRYFASKDDLIRAWTTRELDAIFAAADEASVAAEGDFADRMSAGLAVVVESLRRHPVFRALVAINNTQMMRSTLESGDAVAHAGQLVQQRLTDAVRSGELEIGQFDSAVSAELLARLAISLVVVPESLSRLDSEDDVREFAKRYLMPLATAPRG